MIARAGLNGEPPAVQSPPEYPCVSNDLFRALEEISGNRSQPQSKAGKADDLLVAAVSAFAGITRPGRQDMQQFEDLAMPLLHCASARGKRQAADILARLDEAPRRIVLALAEEPVEISAPLLLRSPLLRPGDLVELTGRHGLAHARVIARRQSDDSLLRCVLHSFADPVIDRTLALQESLADLKAEPLENQPPPDAPAKKPFPMQNAGSEQLAHALQRPFFEVGHLPGSERLIDTALLIDDRFFHHALADTFGLSLDRAETIVGRWPDSYLPIALKALGFSAAECFLTMTAVLGTIETDREGLREFVHIYRSIDREKALALVRRWRAEDMAATLRGKLREMAEDHETPPTDAANCDAPKPSRSVK